MTEHLPVHRHRPGDEVDVFAPPHSLDLAQATAAREQLAAEHLTQQRRLDADQAEQRRQALARLAAEKRNSVECKTAEAAVSYCQTAAQILEVTATIDHMQRVDRASGTVNLTKRRELAETLLVLKDQMSQQRRVLTDLGRHPTTTECTNADGMLRRAREACIPMVPAGGATSK